MEELEDRTSPELHSAYVWYSNFQIRIYLKCELVNFVRNLLQIVWKRNKNFARVWVEVLIVTKGLSPMLNSFAGCYLLCFYPTNISEIHEAFDSRGKPQAGLCSLH